MDRVTCDMHSFDALSLRCAHTQDRGLEADTHRPTDVGQCTDAGGTYGHDSEREA